MGVDESVKLEGNSNAISRVKMPTFCHSSPATWFSLVESTFAISNIKSDELKYHHVLTSLPEDILMTITDLINTPPSIEKYIKIKETILARHTESEYKRMSTLLGGVAIGDDTPSQYFRKLETIAGSTQAITKQFIKQIWLNGLPMNTKSIVIGSASDDTNINQMLITADKIHEVCLPITVSEIQTKSEKSMEARIDQLSEQVSQLSAMVGRSSRFGSSEHSKIRNGFNRNRSQSRNKQRRLVRSKSQVTRYPQCYYHHRYGNEAHRCLKPCNFEEASENSKK